MKAVKFLFSFILSPLQRRASSIGLKNLAFGQLATEHPKVLVSSIHLENSNLPFSEAKTVSAPTDYWVMT